MRTSIVMCVAILSAGMGIGASSLQSAQEAVAPVAPGKAGFPNVYLPMDKLVPKDWKIVGIDTASMPVDTGKPEDRNGLAVTLHGPEMVGGLKAQPESVTIWIMPADYKRARYAPRDQQAAVNYRFGLSAPGTRTFGAPGKWTPSEGLDGTGYMVYFASWGGVKSWPSWEKDIQEFFGIQELVAPGGIKRLNARGIDPSARPQVVP